MRHEGLETMRARLLAVGLAASALSAVLVVACTDGDDSRTVLDVPDAAPDTGASLPDASTESDSGVDAGRDDRGPFDPSDEPVVCSTDAGTCAVQLVAGRNHFCARMSDGTVRCWGQDRFGAVGEAPPDGGTPPVVRTIGSLANVTQLSAAGATTCARLGDGTVDCWGNNQSGQLALDASQPAFDSLDHPVPGRVAVKDPIARVDVGPRVVCAKLETGSLTCWGSNGDKQISQKSSSAVVPTDVTLGSFAIAKVSIGTVTTFGLTAEGNVVSWGGLNGRAGFLGGRLSSVSPDANPALVERLHHVTSFATSATLDRDEEGKLGTLVPPPPPPGGALPHAHACAIVSGEVYCWGRSDFGALCTGLLEAERLPAHAPISGKAWPQQLAVGDEYTCARMTDGSIQCCGADHRGRFGVGFSLLFVPVEAFKGHAVQVATSHRAICALLQDGSVECWGSNQYGELGHGAPDQDAHPTPAKVAF
jgi:alpha-tubulin suppressor-like RCC1 family protein